MADKIFIPPNDNFGFFLPFLFLVNIVASKRSAFSFDPISNFQFNSGFELSQTKRPVNSEYSGSQISLVCI